VDLARPGRGKTVHVSRQIAQRVGRGPLARKSGGTEVDVGKSGVQGRRVGGRESTVIGIVLGISRGWVRNRVDWGWLRPVVSRKPGRGGYKPGCKGAFDWTVFNCSSWVGGQDLGIKLLRQVDSLHDIVGDD
jgi:hypothetical protein